MYEWKKGICQWQVGDTLYLSVPFTWLVAGAEKIASKHKGKVLMGGPGLMKPTHCEGFDPILFHNPCATFTTRGCPNSCSFCAVPKLEGAFRELHAFRPAPVICDNNFTAASFKHQERVVEALKHYPLVDFNQGLEARRFTPELADLLGNLNCHIRFAFDSWGQEAAVKDAIDLCRKRTTKNIGVYCLIGFNDEPDSARARLELIRSWGILPNPMRYQPLDALEKNCYIHPNWTERKLLDTMRYYSSLIYLNPIPFDEYNKTPQLELI
jgi:hypothetical protein